MCSVSLKTMMQDNHLRASQPSNHDEHTVHSLQENVQGRSARQITIRQRGFLRVVSMSSGLQYIDAGVHKQPNTQQQAQN